jgi:hypothetical protein
MSRRRHLKTQEEREKAHQLWEEEIRQKAVRVIKSYKVTLGVERTWQLARSLFSRSLPRKTVGLLFHSVLLPPRNGKVTIAISTTPALRRLKPYLGQITKDLRLLLGNNLQVNLASFESLLGENQ